jgi:hypothetical protein
MQLEPGSLTTGSAPLSGKKEDAAMALAEDRETDRELAERLDINRTTLHRWKQEPAFRERVAFLRAEIREVVRRRGIASVERRVDALNDRWELMKRVIRERGEELAGKTAGGATGLLVRTYKVLGSGEDAELISEFQVDTGLLRELRAHEQQAAQELGQWLERKEVSGNEGAPVIVKVLGGVSLEDL